MSFWITLHWMHGESKMNPFFMEVMDDAMTDILRQKTEVERLRIAARMWTSARVILRGAIRTEHPDWNVDQVNREIARRISHGLVNHESD
jgi:Rv0078B-related antitoxin